MTFDGFFIKHLIVELNQEIAGSRLERIYQHDDASFLFVLYGKGQRHHLTIDLSPSHVGMYLTAAIKESKEQSQFLKSLKKHLEGGIVQPLRQYVTDRVILLDIVVYDMIDGPITKTLVFEAMGKHANLILVKDGIVLDTFKKMFFETGRQLLPQATFDYFPTDGKISFDHLSYDGIENPKDLVKRYLGISPFLASYLYEHPTSLDKLTIRPTKDLVTGHQYVADLFDQTHEKVYYDTISKMMDDRVIVTKDPLISHRQFIEKSLSKYLNKHEILALDYEQAQDKLSIKQMGDCIYQSGLDLSEKRSNIIDQEGHTWPLDPSKTLNENAQLAYKHYQKAKRSIEKIHEQILQNKAMIQLFETFKGYVTFTDPSSIDDLESDLIMYGFKPHQKKGSHKKQTKKPAILTLDGGDYQIMIGKNDHQNAYLTHTLAQKHDMWFHVKDAPGAHVVVRAKSLNEPLIRQASMLAAYFSSLKHSSSIPVDYTEIRHLRKIPKVPGYQVIYHTYKTMFIDIDEEKIASYLSQNRG